MTKPLYCDTNSFAYLSDKSRYDLFVMQLEKSESNAAQDLLRALKSEELIKHPVAFIELFGLRQKIIHQRLEKIMPSLYPDAKKAIDPFYRDFKRSIQNLEESQKLGKGLDAAIDVLYNGFFEHLWYDEPDLLMTNLQGQVESQRQQLTNPSPLFLHKYNYIKGNITESFRKNLIHDLSLEAVYRYGGNLISKLYTGDEALGRRWFDHLSAVSFGLWEQKGNYSAYRLTGDELELLNRKHKLGFFPAKKLRPHDDTVDGYIIHALSFGWFHLLQKLTSVSVLSEDPFNETFERVQQYQVYLAYGQNPLGNNIGATARIRHEVLPGTLYSFNREEQSIKLVSFHPAQILEGNPDPLIQHSHSEIEVISMNP